MTAIKVRREHSLIVVQKIGDDFPLSFCKLA